MFGDSDLSAIFADFGIPFTWTPKTGAGGSATGILDMYEDVYRHNGPGGFQAGQILLRVPAPSLPGIPKAFDVITIPSSPNLPPNFTPGTYTVKELPDFKDPSIIEMVLKAEA